MFIFPLIYLFSFLLAVKELLKGNKEAVLIFLIFGLSIYITSLSIMFGLGLRSLIVFFQSFKELIILSALGISIFTLKIKPRLHFIDYAIGVFFIYTLIYALLPLGENGLVNRLVAFKSTSFFVLVYAAARLFDPKKLYISKYFNFILLLSIAAAIVVLYEVIRYEHLQIQTSLADYNYYLFNIEPSGIYGLSYTFESASGYKRFASFFANPLEHGAATLIALAVIAGLYTTDDYKFKPDLFGKLALAATFISIIFAVSRAPFVSYFIMIYAYALLTRKKIITLTVNACIAAAIVYIFYVLRDNDIEDLIRNTIDFSDPSSAGHVLAWIEGILAIYKNPIGLGLGTSGRLAGSLGETTGGENQFLIIGVQAGLIALILYVSIYISLIRNSWYWFYRLKGKEKKVCLALLLLKTGLIISLLTSEVESSPYISYMTWFISGLFVNMISFKVKKRFGACPERSPDKRGLEFHNSAHDH